MVYNMEKCRKIIEEMGVLADQMVSCLKTGMFRFSNVI